MPETKKRVDEDRLPGRQQDNLLAALVFSNDDNAAKLEARIDPKLFDQPMDDFVHQCLEYREKFDRAPGRAHLDDLVAHVLDKPDHKWYKTYVRIIEGLLQVEQSLDTAFVLDQYNEFAQRRTYRKGIADAVTSYQKGDMDAVRHVMEDTLQRARRMPASRGSNPCRCAISKCGRYYGIGLCIYRRASRSPLSGRRIRANLCYFVISQLRWPAASTGRMAARPASRETS